MEERADNPLASILLNLGRTVALGLDAALNVTAIHNPLLLDEWREPAARPAGYGGIQLEGGDPLDVGGWRLAGQHHLDGFGVFGFVALHIGQQQFMAHAQLFEQLAPARALRGEVDEIGHGPGGLVW